MEKFKNKQTGEIIEAIQFNDENLHRFTNYIRALQGTMYIDDFPYVSIRVNDTETGKFKLSDWCVNRDRKLNPYSEIVSEKQFNEIFEILEILE